MPQRHGRSTASVLLSRHALVPGVFPWSSSVRRSRVRHGHLCNVLPHFFDFQYRTKGKDWPIQWLSRPPSLNQLESRLRFRSSLTEIGFPFRAICALTFSPFFSRCNICSWKFSFPCRSKLSKFMTNPSFSDLTTNRSFSIVNSYGAINEFRQNWRSTWPNVSVQKRISLLHSQQECINKTALPYISSWHGRGHAPARNPLLASLKVTPNVYLLSSSRSAPSISFSTPEGSNTSLRERV